MKCESLGYSALYQRCRARGYRRQERYSGVVEETRSRSYVVVVRVKGSRAFWRRGVEDVSQAQPLTPPCSTTFPSRHICARTSLSLAHIPIAGRDSMGQLHTIPAVMTKGQSSGRAGLTNSSDKSPSSASTVPFVAVAGTTVLYLPYLPLLWPRGRRTAQLTLFNSSPWSTALGEPLSRSPVAQAQRQSSHEKSSPALPLASILISIFFNIFISKM
ncbi:hypothetical protein BD414DRAFT_287260 [Trametes punicea]|nr:hypothetical protein BD414DRAFT_287260 [Trametes punicea]